MANREHIYQVLFRKWYLVFTLSYVGFLYYVTLVPFRFSRDAGYILRKFHKFELIPYFFKFHRYSGADVVLNILLFIPLGVLLFYSGERLYRGHSRFRLVSTVLWGVAISTSIELLQVLTYDRSPTVSDIINNGLGTFVGAVLALWMVRNPRISLRSWRESLVNIPEWLISLGVFALTLFIYLAPFDFKVNVRAVTRRILQFMHNPIQLQGFWLSELMVIFLVFLTFYYFWHAALAVRRSYRLEKTLRLLPVFLPVGLEVLQLGVPLRRISVLDVLMAWSALAVVRHYFQGLHLRLQPALRFDQHRPFLKKLAVGYGVFLGLHLFVLPGLAFNPTAVAHNWAYFVDPLAWILRKDRLLSVIWFMQWTVLFIPFGFFAQGFFPAVARRLLWLTLLIAGCSMPLLLGVPAFQVHWSQLIAALLGSLIGREIWYFYAYLFTRYPEIAYVPKEAPSVVKL